jgi:hypothetical protein
VSHQHRADAAALEPWDQGYRETRSCEARVEPLRIVVMSQDRNANLDLLMVTARWYSGTNASHILTQYSGGHQHWHQPTS